MDVSQAVSHRLDDALEIEGTLVVEVAVLGGQRRASHHGRDLPERHRRTRLGVVTDFGDQLAVAVQDLDGAGRLADIVDARQGHGRVHDQPGQREHQHGDGCTGDEQHAPPATVDAQAASRRVVAHAGTPAALVS